MPSFVDLEGQHLLSFRPPPCTQCRWYETNRCAGPQTFESQLVRHGKLLTCFEPGRLAELLDDLDRHRERELPAYPLLQGMAPAIPMLCSGMPADLALTSPILYGVGLDDVLRKDGSIRYDSGGALRRAFNLSAGARLCLLASVKDNKQEEFWHYSDSRQVWAQIKGLGFEFVTTTSFSVFRKQSRSSQLFNLERNFLCADILARQEIPVVPLLCEILEEDLRYAVRWLERRSTVQVVGGLAQGWKRKNDFDRFISRMSFIKERVERPLHFLILGCSSVDRMPILYEKLGSVTVVSANPVIRGVNGQGYSAQMKFVKLPEIPRSSLVNRNVEEFMKLGYRFSGSSKKVA